MTQPRRRAGFTLIELLVVLTILGLLGAIAGPQVLRYLGSSKTQAARTQVQSIGASLDLYRIDVGRFPTPEEGLRALIDRPATAPAWNGPYLTKRSGLVDPWGSPYLYKVPGRAGGADVYSLGSDKAEGGTGEAQDVGNW